MFCPQCGNDVKDGARFCGNCGWAVPNAPVQNVQPAVFPSAMPSNQNTGFVQTTAADEKFCFSCGSVIKKEAEICPKCGVKQSMQSSNIAAKVNNVAFNILSIFFSVVAIFLCILYYFEDPYFNYPEVESLLFLRILVAIGFLFLILSLYRKKSVSMFVFGICCCGFHVLFNAFIFLTFL